jgi:hypothetical protein
MAGSKTRFGFRGGGDEPPDSDESPAARTIIGHDIHLPKLPSGFEPPRPLGSPTPIPPARVPYTPVRPAAVVAPMVEAITESVPVRRHYRPQRSRLARFLGRWSTGGNFRPRDSAGQPTLLDDADDGALEVPRDRTGRNVLLVLGIAVLTFLVTVALVKIRQRYTTPQPSAGAQVVENQTQASPLPAPPVLPAPAATLTAPPAPPAIPAMPAPAEKPVLLGTPAVTPAPTDSPRPHKPARTAGPSGQPPEHLKGELLPLSQ